jgi:hypothetical protein
MASRSSAANRPAAILVFGILNLLFGILGLFGVVFTLVSLRPQAAVNNQLLAAMQANPAYMLFMHISMGLGFLAAIALLIAGVGLLRAKPWGRTISLGYAVYTMLATVTGVVANSLMIWRPMWKQVGNMPDIERYGFIGGIIGGALGLVFGLSYGIAIWYFMTRPKVIAALNVEEAILLDPAGGPSRTAESGNPYQSP